MFRNSVVIAKTVAPNLISLSLRNQGNVNAQYSNAASIE
jgi:hypothetical protein